MSRMSWNMAKLTGLVALLLGLVLASPSAVLAGGGVPLPELPEAKTRVSPTQGCVEPTEEMRKYHMEMILHQRDETMHRGIRTKQYSLTECINCHVTPGPDGQYPNVSSEDHFCSACHTYASVSIDCFQCHRDKPVDAETVSAGTGGSETAARSPISAVSDRSLPPLAKGTSK